jgi:hypothetical protein
MIVRRSPCNAYARTRPAKTETHHETYEVTVSRAVSPGPRVRCPRAVGRTLENYSVTVPTNPRSAAHLFNRSHMVLNSGWIRWRCITFPGPEFFRTDIIRPHLLARRSREVTPGRAAGKGRKPAARGVPGVTKCQRVQTLFVICVTVTLVTSWWARVFLYRPPSVIPSSQ